MIAIPAFEIWLFIELGQIIGGWMTVLLILLTGFIGAFLAKREFKRVFAYAKHELSSGHIPTESILDGICIFAGGLLLLTPGFITDTIGFALLLPWTRSVCKMWLLRFIRRKIDTGQIQFMYRR